VQPFRVALLFHRDLAYCRGVLAGIEDWIKETGTSWRVRHAPSTSRVIPSLREWQPDGVLGHIFDEELARSLRRLDKPLVNTTLTIPWFDVPTIDAHHHQVGRLAADYLLQRSFQSFAFFGNKWALFSKMRERGFEERLNEAGFSARVHYEDYLPMRPTSSSWVRSDDEVGSWLMSLPKPTGIFCCHDVPACDLIEVCATLKISVPDEIAILGVDNDRFECELAHPTLSSIALPLREIGWNAAAMLDKSMHGKAIEDEPQLFAPTHVVARRSTDMHAVKDDEVRKALMFIKESSTRPISVDDVASAAGLSRRQLERRFRDAMGRPVLSEIHRLRVELAMELLAESNLKIEAVAYRAGFSGARQMGSVFRRTVGKSPSECRKSAQPLSE